VNSRLSDVIKTFWAIRVGLVIVVAFVCLLLAGCEGDETLFDECQCWLGFLAQSESECDARHKAFADKVEMYRKLIHKNDSKFKNGPEPRISSPIPEAPLPASQSGCPPVNFALPADVLIDPTSDINLGFIERKPDGSYTRHRYQFALHPQIDATPNFLATIVPCTGYPRRASPAPAGWRPASDNQLGVTSNAPWAADLTGSGILDLVLPSQDQTANSVLVALSDSVYSDGPRADLYDVGVNPWTAASGDFNGDGKRDLVVFSGGSYASDSTLTTPGVVSVLINNGDGTFKPAVNYAAGGSTSIGTVQDFNGDGKLDIAAVDVAAGSIVILLGNGDGTLRAGPTTSVPHAYAVAAADLNGDFKQDLAVMTSSGMVALLGNGDGTFRALPPAPVVGGSNPALADFNKDGKMDVVVADYASQTAQVLFGAGDGTFPTSVRYLLGSLPLYVLATDVDFDGNPDIVIGSGHPDGLAPSLYDPDELSILFGNGDGTFYGPRAIPVAAGSYTSSMAAGDFNGDGRPDIALTAPDGATQVLLQQSGGGFQTATIASGGYGIVAKDFNGDSKLDLVVAAGPSNSVLFAAGNGNGTFQNPVTIATGLPSNSVDAGDLNGDGKLDLVTASGSSFVTVLLGNGNGTFQSPKTVSGFANPVDAKLADLNGDGKLDMVVVNGATLDSSGNSQPGAGISILLGKGDGTFQQPVTLSAGGLPTRAFIADVNRDGKPDILVVTEDANTFTSEIAVFLNAGNGTFSAPAFIVTLYGTDLAVADLNNDGSPDLLITRGTNINASYMLGNGDGTFQPEVFLSVGQEAGSVLAADFNGDGKVDAAVAASFNPTTADYVAVLTNVTAAGAPAVPAPASTSPGSGYDTGQTFTFTFSDSGGYQNLSVVDVLINSALDGRRACYVAFVPSGANSGSVYLVDDAGDAGGPYQGLVLPGGSAISNGQCTISGTGSSAAGSGETLTLRLPSRSARALEAIRWSTRPRAINRHSTPDGRPLALGAWCPSRLPGPSTRRSCFRQAPRPHREPQTLTFYFVDTKGVADFGVVNVLINNFIDGRQACYLAYVKSSNTLLLVDDAGDAGGPFAGSMVLDGRPADIQNSQCIVDAAGSSASTTTGIGNTLTLSLNMIFKSGFTGNHVIWVAGRDAAGANNTGWQAMGTTTVQ